MVYHALFLSFHLTDSSRRQTTLNTRECIQHLGHCFLGDHSFTIYSFPPMDLETSVWMLNSCSTIYDCPSSIICMIQDDIKDFETQTIFSSTHLFSSSLNIITMATGLKTQPSTTLLYILTWHLTWMTSEGSVYMKTYLALHISLKDGRIFLISQKIQHFQISFTCQTCTWHF